MTLAHARALITRHHIIEAEHDPARDRAALHKLANWAIRFTPLVAPVPPSDLTLDVTGCHRLYKDERRMLNAIGNSLERLGLVNRLCCASTIGCAWALAHFGSDERTIVAPGSERAALEALPVEALRIDDETARALHEVNVDRIGEVFALPRLELAARFNVQLLHRIDQALGDAAEVVDSIHPTQPVMAERVFSGAVTSLEGLFIVTHELIAEAVSQLLRQERGAVRIDLTLTRLDATPIHLGCRLSRPSRDVKHLFSLLKPKVETVNMGYGVERVLLVVTTAERVKHQQRTEFGADPDSPSLTGRGSGGGSSARLKRTRRTGSNASPTPQPPPSREGEIANAASARDAPMDHASGALIDVLSERLGPARAVRVCVRESHVPERIVALKPAIDGAAAQQRGKAALVEADRPSQLLRRPELIDVMAITPDGPPAWLRWRGAEHRIARAAGPERINCEWWSAGKDGAEEKWRDYFKVQDEAGRWLWIFRAQHTGRWFAHGEWA